MANDKVNAYEIKFYNGGITDWEDKGLRGGFKFGSGLDIRRKIDSLTSGQALIDIGITPQSISASISPSASKSPSPSNSPSPSPSARVGSPSASLSPSASKSPSASQSPSHSVSSSPSPSAGLHTVFSDLIYTFVKCSDGFIYGFGNTGSIYKINPNDLGVQRVYNVGQGIKGAIEAPTSSGKSYLVFATNTNLHRKELPGKSDWSDVNVDVGWPKTNLSSADWHTMVNITGDTLIANGPTLAMFAYDDSYTNEALDLIPGNIAKTLVERRGRVVVGTVRASDPTQGINAAIDSEVPLAQMGNNGMIVYADFSSSMPAKQFPGGGKVNPGGVCNQIDQAFFFDWQQTALSWIDKQAVGNMSLWGVWGGTSGKNGIYSYGRFDKAHPFVMNLDYKMDVDEIGAICHIGALTIASYRSGSTFGVMVTDVNNKATGVYEGLDYYSSIKHPIDITIFRYTELYMAPLPAGCSVEFWYRINKTGAFVQAKTADGNTSFSTAGGKKAVFNIGAEAEVFEPRVVLNPSGNSAPEVYRIRTYFS